MRLKAKRTRHGLFHGGVVSRAGAQEESVIALGQGEDHERERDHDTGHDVEAGLVGGNLLPFITGDVLHDVLMGAAQYGHRG